MKKKILEIIKEEIEEEVYIPIKGEYPPIDTHIPTWAALNKTSPSFTKDGELKSGVVPRKLKQNYALILEGDPVYKSLCYHEHSDRILWKGEEIKPHHYEDIALDIEIRYLLTITEQNLLSAVLRVAHMRQITPIKDYLSGLQWDGEERLYKIATNILKAETLDHHRDLIQTMSKKMWIGYVARIFEPGCKNDIMSILIGPKGTGKSKCMEIMAGAKWFSRSDVKIGGKEALELIHQSGVWIWELAELKSLQGKTADTAKQFFSGTEDRFRPSYGRHPVNRKRRVCFFGSSNNYQILEDGPERRFWIYKNTGAIDLEYLQNNRDQIWAEAVYWYQQGENWWLDYPQEAELARYQRSFLIDDPWAYYVAQSIESLGINATTSNIMEALEIPVAHRHVGNSKRINQICRDLGYTYKQQTDGRRIWKKS